MRTNKCIYDFQLLEGEELRQIEEFPRYMVSNMGRVFSYTNPEKPKMLRPSPDGFGYNQVALMRDGKRITKKVARLVAKAFIPNPLNKPQVDHILPISEGGTDEASNLRWATASENQRNQRTYEKLKTRLQQMSVERSYTVYAYDKQYNQVSAFTSTAEAARQLNYSQGNLSSCCQGSLPTYKGLIWSYDPELTEEKREELLAQNKDKFIRNRLSTCKAVEKYRKKPENVQKSREKSLKYYYEHREELKVKHRAWYERVKQRREEGTA